MKPKKAALGKAKKSGWESWKGIAKNNRDNRRAQAIKNGTFRKRSGGKDNRSDFEKALDEHKHDSITKFR